MQVNFSRNCMNEFPQDVTKLNKWCHTTGLIDSDNNTAKTDIEKSADEGRPYDAAQKTTNVRNC